MTAVVGSLRAELSASIAQFTSDMGKAADTVKNAGNQMQSSFSGLGSIFSPIADGIGSIGSNLTSLSSIIGGLVGAAGLQQLWSMFKGALDAAAQLALLSQQTGITTDSIQALQFAGVKAGIGFDTINNGLLMFNKNLGDFLQNQAGPGAKAFTDLGIKAQIAAGDFTNTNDVLAATIMALSKITDSSLLAAESTELFGRQLGPQLAPLIEQSNGSLATLIDLANQAGIVLGTDTVDAAADANAKLDTLFYTIKQDGTKTMAEFAPQIEAITDAISEDITEIGEWIDEWSKFFGYMNDNYPLLGKIISAAASAAKAIANPESTAWNEFLGPLYQVATGQQITTGLFAAPDPVNHNPAEIDKFSGHSVGGAQQSPLQLGAPANAAAQAAALAKKQQADLEQQKQFNDQMQELEAKANQESIAAQDQADVTLLQGKQGYYDALRKQAEDNATAQLQVVDTEETKELDKVNDLITKAKALNVPYQELEDAKTAIVQTASDKRNAIVIKEGETLTTISQQEAGALGALARTAQGPLNDALNTVAANGLNAFGDALASIVTNTSSVSDAFKSMIDSIISDLIRLEAQREIEGPIADFLSGFLNQNGSGVGGIFGNLFGSGSTAVVGKGTTNLDLGSAGGSGGGGGAAGAGASNGAEQVFGQSGSSGAVPNDQAAAPDSGSIEINLTVENKSDSSASATSKKNSGGGVDIRVLLDKATADNINRSGTETSKALARRGLGPQLTRR